MFKKTKDIPDSKLKKALEACRFANRDGYNQADKFLEQLKKSIENANTIITYCISDLKKRKVSSPDIYKSVEEQLKTVQTLFDQTYYDTRKSLNQKKKQEGKFNITLFGRTKAGKSTLMEILTHGDGSHMGEGGQRTTRDVRSYDWHGLSVTDIPGIDAYDGEVDDEIAEDAAKYADLILFMITAGQPSNLEAQWLVKLKKMDKPIICICNYKKSIADEGRLNKFLRSPEKVEEQMNIDELQAQFNKFIQERLPEEHVEFYVCHLISEFYSQQKQYAGIKEQLHKISRFDEVNNVIIQEVYRNGVLHKLKSYLSLIDSPLYQQTLKLFDFSAQSYHQYRLIEDKYNGFIKWSNEFNRNQIHQIYSLIELQYDMLKNSIGKFVDDNLRCSDGLEKKWEKYCDSFQIGENINKELELCSNRLKDKVSETFRQLIKESSISFNTQFKFKIPDLKSITDWKRITQWAGAMAGSAGSILGLLGLCSGPVGWALVGAGLVLGGVACLFTSKEKKLAKNRQKLTVALNESVKTAKAQMKKEVFNWFNKAITKQEETVWDQLYMLSRSMISLSNSERELALNNNKNHIEITKRIVENILNSMHIPESEQKKVILTARVPGRRLALIVQEGQTFRINRNDFSKRLGNQEQINVIYLQMDKSSEEQILHLFRYFQLDKPHITHVNNNTQTVVYVRNTPYTREQYDSMELIQQIMNAHIIIK